MRGGRKQALTGEFLNEVKAAAPLADWRASPLFTDDDPSSPFLPNPHSSIISPQILMRRCPSQQSTHTPHLAHPLAPPSSAAPRPTPQLPARAPNPSQATSRHLLPPDREECYTPDHTKQSTMPSAHSVALTSATTGRARCRPLPKLSSSDMATEI